MALWTAAKVIRLTWTQSRTTVAHCGRGIYLIPDPDLRGEKDLEHKIVCNSGIISCSRRLR